MDGMLIVIIVWCIAGGIAGHAILFSRYIWE